eukprot:NODE_6566_length_870_cov_60.599732_g5970_i0.p1 GENE.NODE_6566_length_870_cov_60.599732_g5970_i0~~NODE_6566_length_870_cov_60.599732_g5970_i0.p1  ORF type:complete len:236 (+),score=53.09 NODE_6566_length_870_cov_60.599732_g5970_i0:55-762(+)
MEGLKLLVLFCMILSISAFGKGMGVKADPRAEPLKKEIPIIAYDVCLRAVESSFLQSNEIRKTSVKLHEDQLADMVENLCEPSEKEGKWIRALEIVLSDETETKSRQKELLVVEHKGEYGKCGRECETIAAACRKSLDNDLLDLSEALYKQKPSALAKLQSKFCKKQKKNKKPVPNDFKRKDEKFNVMSEDDIKMEDMQKSMQKSRLGGTMYHRDDFAGMDFSSMDEDMLGDMGQ